MERPYPSRHHYQIREEALQVTPDERRWAPATQKGSGEWESLRLGATRCDYLSRADFRALIARWLAGRQFHHVVTLNPEMVMLAETDAAFARAVIAAELAVPDGSGLIWARWFLRSDFWSLLPSLLAFPFVNVERISGIDAILDIAAACTRQQAPVYLMGGTATQISKTKNLLESRYPGLTIAVAPDHRYDVTGPPALLGDINRWQPAALLVAYGAPNQAVWIAKHRSELPTVRIAMGVGGAFAMLSEDRPRAPQILRRLNTEWLWRLMLEPRRLPRIWRATIKFPMFISRQKHHPNTP